MKYYSRWCFSIFFVLVIQHHLASVTLAILGTKDVVVTLADGAKTSTKKTTTTSKSEQLLPLSSSYYQRSCPNLEGIIQQKVDAWVQRDNTMAASLIRLHFHDCAVRGCDASILLNHTGSERRAMASRTLRGFEVIDEIKGEVEKQCLRGTVSCADILTAAARDATVMAGGPFWEVPFGRKDGRVSSAKEANNQVPQGHENVTALIHFFQSRGLDILDLVVLSGAHTIGRSSCFSIQPRLVTTNNGTGIDLKYLSSLRKQCSSTNGNNFFVNLDVTTPKTFDEIYYANLEKKMGLLLTDQRLYSDPRTAPLVAALVSQPSLFFNQFAVSMVNLGNIVQANPTAKNQGEIRLNCNYVNPAH